MHDNVVISRMIHRVTFLNVAWKSPVPRWMIIRMVPSVFLECCEEEGEFTNRTCARVFVLERLLQKCPWRSRMGSNDSFHQGTFSIQGCRSEERRVGKECGVLCSSRWSPYH